MKLKASRILSVMLVLSMIIMLLSVGSITALAVTDHTDHTSWIEWTATSGSVASGNYYMESSVTATGEITISEGETVTFCLNGNTLDMGENMLVVEGNLIICDCSGGETGVIEFGFNSYLDGDSSSSITLESGNIHNRDTSTFGTPAVRSKGDFAMTGGKLSAKADVLELYSGTAVVSGGTIENISESAAITVSVYTYLTLSGSPTITTGGSDAEIFLNHYAESDSSIIDNGYEGEPLKIELYGSAAGKTVVTGSTDTEKYSLPDNGDFFLKASGSDLVAAANRDIWVCGVQVTDENASNILEDDTASYDKETNILTLNGFAGTEVYGMYNCSPVIYADNELTIELNGTNTITLNDVYDSHGIYVEGNITFIGSGTLSVSGSYYDPINSNGSINFGDDEKYYAFTGTVRAETDEDCSAGNAIRTPEDESINIYSGTVQAVNNYLGYGTGLNGGNVNVYGGSLEAFGNGVAIDGTFYVETGLIIMAGSEVSDAEVVDSYDNQEYVKIVTAPHLHDDVTYAEWTATSGAVESGSYYLADDVEATGNISITGDAEVTLCLNGNTLDMGDGYIWVYKNSTINICDCGEGGTITSDYGNAIDNDGGNTNLYSGNIVSTKRYGIYNSYTYSYSLYPGMVHIYGGTVKGADSGIYNDSESTVYISGGEVIGEENYAIKNQNKLFLSGSPALSGDYCDIYTGSRGFYATESADLQSDAYIGEAVSIYPEYSLIDGDIIYNVKDVNKNKFTLISEVAEVAELKLQGNNLMLVLKSVNIRWFDEDGTTIIEGEDFTESLQYGAELDPMPEAPAKDGKIFVGWLYKYADETEYNPEIVYDFEVSNMADVDFKAVYVSGFEGDGTEQSPFLIKTADDLVALSRIINKGIDDEIYNTNERVYRLENDIDLSSVCGPEKGSFIPVGNDCRFYASFDGNGKSISNLYINSSDDCVGLFGTLDGDGSTYIKDLTLSGTVKGYRDVGMLAGYATGYTVSGCVFSGNVMAENIEGCSEILGGRDEVVEENNNAEDVVRGICVPGYIEHEGGKMAYGKGGYGWDIKGNPYATKWLSTTYGNVGYEHASKCDEGNMRVVCTPKFISGGNFVQLNYTVTAGDSGVKGGKLGVHADIEIGENDDAAVKAIVSDGKVIGISMKEGDAADDGQFNLYFGKAGGVTPVTTYWYGSYSSRRSNLFKQLSEETKSGIYNADLTELTDTDSGFAVSWQGINLAAGKSKTYSIVVGIGQVADPPVLEDTDLDIEVSASFAEDKLLNYTATVKDDVGCIIDLYSSIENTKGEVVDEEMHLGNMEVVADNQVTFDGAIDLSDLEPGAYKLTFWTLNEAGAMSASRERNIVIESGNTAVVPGMSGDIEGANAETTVNAQLVNINGDTYDVIINPDGSYKVNAPKGEYQLIINAENSQDSISVTKTEKVTIAGDETVDIVLPDGEKNSSVEVLSGVDTAIVGGLDDIADSVVSDDKIEIKLSIKEAGDDKAEQKEEINEAIGDIANKSLKYLDITLNKITNDITIDDSIGNTNNKVLEVIVPHDTDGRKNFAVYRHHGGEVQPFKRIYTRPTTFTDMQFYKGDGYIIIYSKNFSVYAISDEEGIDVQPTTPTTGGGGSTSYLVKFDTNGGSIVASRTVYKNSVLSAPLAPTKYGFAFDGWYTDKELTQKYDFAAKVTKSFTLYAKWNEDETKSGEAETKKWNPFVDVKAEDWFHDAVKEAYLANLVTGTTDTTFSPNGDITRAMFVTILYRMENQPQTAETAFVDLEDGFYYLDAVGWASKNQIVKGITETEFAPNDSITREQMAAMLFRYAQYKGTEAMTLAENLGQFKDGDSASEYAVSALNWAVGTGIISGKLDGVLDPLGNATRAEATTMLVRLGGAFK